MNVVHRLARTSQHNIPMQQCCIILKMTSFHMLHHFENDKYLHIVIQEFLDLDYLHILAKIANIGIFGHFLALCRH